MSLTNIGKILFVDDIYDATIKQAVISLVEKGLPIQFWDGKGDFPEIIRNVRVVILDLDLTNLGTRSPGSEYYYPAAEALHKIPGPYIVIIMAIDFQENDPMNLESCYEDTYGCPLYGSISHEGLTKDEEIENPSRLEKLIVSSISGDRILNLILSWEGLVDRAKDKALSDLIAKEVEDAILSLVKSLCSDFGSESAAREFVNIMMRIVSRRASEGIFFKNLQELIGKLSAAFPDQTTDYPSKEDLLLYNRIMFYEPLSEEGVLTGDIYKTAGESKYDEFAIVLTPICDIVQGKAIRVLTCFAFELNERYFNDPEYPPYKRDAMIIKLLAEGKSISDLSELLISRYLHQKQKIQDNFYIIWNFRYETEILGICFDFNNVRSVDINEVSKWRRICRLDSPFIGEVIEKYGNLVSKVGTIDINRCPHKLRESLER